MHKQAGFSLVELIVVIGLITFVTAISIPAIVGWLPNYRLRAAAQDMLSNFQRAKLEAVKRNINTAVSYTSTGYTVFVDAVPDFSFDGGEAVVMTVNWSEYPGVSASSDFDTFNMQKCIAFRPNGIPVDVGGGIANGTLSLTVPNGRIANVVVSQAGSVRIDTVIP